MLRGLLVGILLSVYQSKYTVSLRISAASISVMTVRMVTEHQNLNVSAVLPSGFLFPPPVCPLSLSFPANLQDQVGVIRVRW